MSAGERLGTAPPGKLRRAAERAAEHERDEAVDPATGDGDTGGDGTGDTRLTEDDVVSVGYYLTSTSPPEPAVRERPAAAVARLRSALVKPPGYDRMLLTLQTHRVVLLLGPAGTGRETAGLGLLADTGAADVSVVRDPTRAELDGHEFGAGSRVLVDLRTVAVDRPEELEDSLRVLIGRVTKASGYVVLLSEPGLHPSVEETHSRYAGTIGPVSAANVLMAHLRGRGASSDLLAAVEESTAVQDICRGARPGLAARLAIQLLAYTDPPMDSGLTSWLARRVNAFVPFGNEVTVRFDAAERLERSLLLSAALVENLSVSALQIEDILLDQLGRPRQPPPLGLVGFGVRLTRLDQIVRGDDGLIRFKQELHAIDLWCHVWTNYPQLRSALIAWMRAIPDAAVSLERAERFAVAEQFVKVCDRLNADQPVIDLVEPWANGRRESRLAAVLVLSKAALSWTIGRQVRDHLGRWATDKGLSLALQEVVLHTCSGPFAHCYPRVALTLLGQFAERSTSIGPRARTAIVELARDDVVRPYVVQSLVEWFGRDSRRDLTLEVLEALLSTPQAELGSVSRGWNRIRASLVELARQAFDERGTDAAKRVVTAFLEHAVRADAKAMVDIVVDAARGSSLRLSRLAWAAAVWLTDNRWNVDGVERRPLYERVATSVDSIRSVRGRHILPNPRRCGA